LNEPPPFCALTDCISCSATQFEDDFNALAGIWKSPYNAGMNDEIAYPCSNFYQIDDLDPCQGSAPTISPAPSIEPTISDNSAASANYSVLASVAVALGALVLRLR